MLNAGPPLRAPVHAGVFRSEFRLNFYKEVANTTLALLF